VTDRSHPSDPAGTQPKVDPDTLRSRRSIAELTSGGPTLGAPRTDPPPRDTLPEPIAPAEPPAPVVPALAAQAPHSPRFHFMLGALGAVALAAIALAIGLATRPAKAPSVPWSSWQPSSEGGDLALQIAEHVEPEYLLSAGHTLVEVKGGPQAIGGQPVVVALRSSGSKPVALSEDGVFYQLCGTGPRCSIPGKPSLERGLLVRREALELALYTFRYIKDASQVIVTYPPLPPTSSGKGSKAREAQSAGSTSSLATTSASTASGAPSRVLLFQPETLDVELSKPLQDTLSEFTPTLKTIARAPEAQLVNTLTENLLYDSVLVPQEQSQVLLLQQASIGG
jgi:hypothetical protein